MTNDGKKGLIITGEKDYYRKRQLKMVSVFKEVGFQCPLLVIPGSGHTIPKNFSELLDKAIIKIN